MLVAGPSELPLKDHPAQSGLHVPITLGLVRPNWSYKKGTWHYTGPPGLPSSGKVKGTEEGAQITLHVLAWGSLRKKLFFVRHGESKWNAAKREKNLVGLLREHDHALTEVGYQQALVLQHGLRRSMARLRSYDGVGWRR